MNILIPHSWLKNHVDTNLSAEEIQKLVSLSGPSIERIYDKEGEKVFDIEVTTNRVDAMSVRGIAREVDVILNQNKKKSKLLPLNLPEIKPPVKDEELPLPEIINDHKLNRRLVCVILKDVKRVKTPTFMAKRLTLADMNVHEAVIDITNYVTHELGHPCHAFDYDKVMAQGGKFIITEAKKGEKFTTLDGENYQTLGGEVVFKNGQGKIVDLPSIKGTANTSIDDQTRNILFLMESIVPHKVRFASMAHAIRTTAAQLMEKNTSPELIDDVLKKSVQLYQEICHAKIGSKVFDLYPHKIKGVKVKVSREKIDKYLGFRLKNEQILNILHKLEFACKYIKNSDSFEVVSPTFRSDIELDVDVIEELARIYGYHNFEPKIMDGAIPLIGQAGVDFRAEDKIKNFLVNRGVQETYTYSMVSEELAMMSGYQLNEHLKIKNELSSDRVYLRRSLLPSLFEVLEANKSHSLDSVFEMAGLYHPVQNSIPNNDQYLSIMTTKNYRHLKGLVESMLEQFFVTNVQVSSETNIKDLESGADLLVTHQGKIIKIGEIGLFKSLYFAATITFKNLLTVAKSNPTYQPIPKYEAVLEDLTFRLPNSVKIQDIIKTIGSVSKLIEIVRLKDVYQDRYTFSIAYRSKKANVSGEEITPERQKIVQTLAQKYQAQLIGQI